jgi:NAD(P)-dependent dehydrogenase (short-subunit alcohol dehydrogenase family)
MSTATPIPRRLDGVVCVVTGAARGIGYAIAERLAAEGGRVACLDVSKSRTGPAVEQLTKGGAEMRGYSVDVGSRSAVAETATAIERDFGAPVGVLVNNAVWARFPALADIDEEAVDRTLNVGLKALIWTTQAFAPQMQRRGGGSIINLSSTSAVRALTHSMIYAAMKAGVLGLTRAAAVELSPHRIRVNTIVPGMVGTPASKAQYDVTTLAARLATMPLARFGEPEEIAAAVAFLASHDASYIQGAEIVVDGGWTIAAQ